ncbi:hypothetical protein [Streptomyces sp. NPDC056464]|uniref:hypothetical protein n=1 Tax=Streptomyces sp. NPDC056464 TaxID=3345828 RepID=UPI00369468B4
MTTIAGTGLFPTAGKTENGPGGSSGAGAGFMCSVTAVTTGPRLWREVREDEGAGGHDQYPLFYSQDAWDVTLMLELQISGLVAWRRCSVGPGALLGWLCRGCVPGIAFDGAAVGGAFC